MIVGSVCAFSSCCGVAVLTFLGMSRQLPVTTALHPASGETPNFCQSPLFFCAQRLDHFKYQSDLFIETRRREQEIDKIFDGFVFFPDNSSLFPRTFSSMPTILAQEVYDENTKEAIDIYDIYDSIKRSDSLGLPAILYRNNYQVKGTGPDIPYITNLFPANSYEVPKLQNKFNVTYKELVRYSIFRMAPDILKIKIYNDGEWLRNNYLFNSLLGTEDSAFPRNTQFHDSGESHQALRSMVESRITAIHTDYGYFKYMHSFLTHAPIGLDQKGNLLSNPARDKNTRISNGIFIFKSLGLLFDKLKRQNVYDNTFIVIAADHGMANDLFGRTEHIFPYHSAAALLIVKDFNKRGSLRVDNYPTQNLDISKTIADRLGLNHTFTKGIDIFSLNRPGSRSREFFDYTWSSSYHGLDKGIPPVEKYTIDGPLRDPRSWGKPLLSLGCSTKIDFFNANHAKYYLAGGFSHHEHWGRWSNEKVVELNFKIESLAAKPMP